jgi:Transposase DDE domain
VLRQNECYFDWKPHLICDASGVATRFVVHPARFHDTTAVDGLVSTLLFGEVLLGNRGNVSDPLYHHLDARYGVTMIAIQRAKIQPNTPAEQRLLRMHRKLIETSNSQLEKIDLPGSMPGISRKIALALCELHVSNHC